MKLSVANRLQGIQEYYFSKKLDEVRKMKSEGHDVINLGIVSPDLAPSPQSISATIEALKDPKNHGYSPYRSLPELRRAMADWYQRIYQVDLDPNSEVLPLLGSKEGILYVSLAFLNPGDKALIPNPGYPAYEAVTKMVGVQVEYYDLLSENDWLPDFKKLNKQDLKKCKIMWVNYPHMPTGRKADPRVFTELVAFGKAHNILICHDNPYGMVLNIDPPTSILKFDPKKEVCLELNSFSKAFNMAGWRVGMCAAQREVIDAILQVKSNVDSGMFAPIQSGAIAALQNAESWHSERNDIYRKRRDVVFKIFDIINFKYDPKQVGLFVWAKAPDAIADVPAFVDRLLYEANVFLVPGFVFGSNGSRFARSSLCGSQQILETALDRISKWKARGK